MFSRTAMHRPAAILAAAALAVGAAGCGGSDDDGGGSGSDAYASTWNDVCQSLTTAQATLQSEGAAAQKKAGTDKDALAKASAEPSANYLKSLIAGLDKVKDLDAPDEFADFQKQVTSSAPETISFFKAVEKPVASGDLDAVTRAFKRLSTNRLFPQIPEQLAAKATACKSVSP